MLQSDYFDIKKCLGENQLLFITPKLYKINIFLKLRSIFCLILPFPDLVA